MFRFLKKLMQGILVVSFSTVVLVGIRWAGWPEQPSFLEKMGFIRFCGLFAIAVSALYILLLLYENVTAGNEPEDD